MPDRYFVMGQFFITDGTAVISTTGRKTADTNFTCVGAGNFTIYMTQGITGTCAGTNVQGTPVTLNAGSNTITTTGAVADGVIDITVGTAANWNSVQSWAAASGGTGGASVPTNADNAYFDANSFTGAAQVVTVDATATCLNMDWTGATNTPTLTLNTNLTASGNVTFIAAMVGNGSLAIIGAGTPTIVTMNTLSVTFALGVTATGKTLQLADAFTSTRGILVTNGTINTNDQTVTCREFYDNASANTKTVTLGNSTINVTQPGGTAGWAFTGAGALTLTANTATINVSQTYPFAGGGATTYNIVNLTGSAHTVSGTNTFTTFALPAATTQTITFTDGTTQTATNFTLDGDATHQHTLQGSSTGQWYLAKAGGGTVTVTYCTVKHSYVTPGSTWIPSTGMVNGGANYGWYGWGSGVVGNVAQMLLLEGFL